MLLDAAAMNERPVLPGGVDRSFFAPEMLRIFILPCFSVYSCIVHRPALYPNHEIRRRPVRDIVPLAGHIYEK